MSGEHSELCGERVGGERSELEIGMRGVHSELCLRDDWRAERAYHFGCVGIFGERSELENLDVF